MNLSKDHAERMNRFFHIVRDSYSTDSAIEKYTERVNEGLRKWEIAVVERFFPAEGRVLVVGCGAGREAFALERMGFQVTGVDLSTVLLARAQEIAAMRDSAVEFCIGDGTKLDVSPESFLGVTLWSQVLGNVPGQKGRAILLRECFKVLKPGGILSLSVHDFERTFPLLSKNLIVSERRDLEEGDLLLRESELEHTIRYWHYFTQCEIEQACQAAGFENIHLYHTSDLGEAWNNVFVVVCSKSMGTSYT